jgi:hypothetical protein
MITLDKEEAFGRELPKWPKLKITGKSVSTQQAKDIIFKTDGFFTSLGALGGNDEKWIRKVLLDAGITSFRSKFDSSIDGWRAKFNVTDFVNDSMGVVSLNYLQNDWASSCFAYGPNGWCWPDGTISNCGNIGKWPSVEDVYEEFVLLANAFPYLEMVGTLFSGEHCEEGTQPIITFVVCGGTVYMTDEHADHHVPVKIADFSDERMCEVLSNPNHEHGLPEEWVKEWSQLVKPHVDMAITMFYQLRK